VGKPPGLPRDFSLDKLPPQQIRKGRLGSSLGLSSWGRHPFAHQCAALIFRAIRPFANSILSLPKGVSLTAPSVVRFHNLSFTSIFAPILVPVNTPMDSNF